MSIRPAIAADSHRLWLWANDPDVRASSFHTDPIPWSDHEAWFRAKLADRNCSIYVIQDAAGVPVGQVRFDIKEGHQAEVSISIGGEHRGRGLGSAALHLACQRLVAESGVSRLVAKIRPDNEASVSAFRRIGFVEIGDTEVHGTSARVLVRHDGKGG